MDQPARPDIASCCPGAVQTVLGLGDAVIAFHSDGACTAFESDSLRAVFKTSGAETYGQNPQRTAVLTVSPEGTARLVTAAGGALKHSQLAIKGLEGSVAVANSMGVASASARYAARMVSATAGLGHCS